MGDEGWNFQNKKNDNPFVGDYDTEMKNAPDMDQELASWYQYIIDMLRLMVELGRVDIITEVSMMAHHMAMPREGHLEGVFHAG